MIEKKVLRTPEAAEFVGLSVSTMEKKRLDGTGPIFLRLGGRSVGYMVSDLIEWLEKQRRKSTSDKGGKS